MLLSGERETYVAAKLKPPAAIVWDLSPSPCLSVVVAALVFRAEDLVARDEVVDATTGEREHPVDEELEGTFQMVLPAVVFEEIAAVCLFPFLFLFVEVSVESITSIFGDGTC